MEHRPRKRFGQNFLIDDTVVDRIVAAIDPRAGDSVVEIGPGLGALTAALLARIPALDAIELDRDLIPELKRRCGGLGTLTIHQADALSFDYTRLATSGQPLRIVGNLPYNISTPLLFHLLAQKAVIRDMHFMLQKEVVERMAASSGGRDYGRLSVMLQYHCRVDALFMVPPQAFSPAPKVESAVVRLVPHARPPVTVASEPTLEIVVTQAFAQRRKTLRNNFKRELGDQDWRQLDIAPERRAETLSLPEFARLADCIHARISAGDAGDNTG